MTLAEFALMVAPGLATGIGGLGLLVFGPQSDRSLDVLLGLTAGIMLAATIFSLLIPALDRGGLIEVLVGFAVGALLLARIDAAVPHLHPRLFERDQAAAADSDAHRKAALLLSAMTIHNVPEGMAVGVAFAAGGIELGLPIAVAIGVQNIPEGFAAAAPLLETGMSRGRVAAIGAATGLVEPPAALIAFAAASRGEALLPFALAFAAAAMLYVVVDELLPEAATRGHEREATLALFAGFMLMMILDVSLS
ncbi:MAG: ZIP family metal transporter [Thermoleophilia bacterium]|nr:ZIP family metal transporter [Thermoleophilia bacterium]